MSVLRKGAAKDYVLHGQDADASPGVLHVPYRCQVAVTYLNAKIKYLSHPRKLSERSETKSRTTGCPGGRNSGPVFCVHKSRLQVTRT